MWQMWAAIAGVAAFNCLCMLALYAEIDAMRRRLDRESDIANAGGQRTTVAGTLDRPCSAPDSQSKKVASGG